MSVIDNSPVLGTFTARDKNGATYDVIRHQPEPGVDVEISDKSETAYFTFDASDLHKHVVFLLKQMSDEGRNDVIREVLK